MALVCVFVENIAFFTEDPNAGFNTSTAIFAGALIIFMLFVYFLVEHKKNKMKVDFVLLPIILILLAVSLVSIWLNGDAVIMANEELGYTMTVYISLEEKVVSSIQSVIIFASMYAIGFVFSKGKIRSKKLLWLAICVMIANLVFCVISAVKDTYIYDYIISGSLSKNSTGARSIFYNENNFSLSLIIGIISSFIVMYHKPKWWWCWACVTILYVFVVLSTCATNIFIGFLLILLYALVTIISNFAQKRYTRATVGSAFFLGTMFIFIFVLGFGNSLGWKFASSILKYIQGSLFTKDWATVSGRTGLWATAIKMFNYEPLRMFIGYGHGISNVIFNAYFHINNPEIVESLNSCHNGFLQIVISGGLVFISLYALLIVYYLYCCVRLLFKKRIRFVCTYFIFFLALFIHDFVESTYMFEVSVMGMLVSVLVFLPPIIAWKQIKHPRYEEDVRTAYAMPTQGVPSRNFVSFIATIIVSIIISLASLFIVPAIYKIDILPIPSCLLYIILFLAISVVFVPYLSFLWYKKSTNVGLVFKIILNTLWIVGCPFGIVVLLRIFTTINVIPARFTALGLYFINLVLSILFYSRGGRGNIKQWFVLTIKGIFADTAISNFIAAIAIIIANIVLSLFVDQNLLNICLILLSDLAIYWTIYIVVPSKKKSEILNDFNEESLLTLKRLCLEDRC